MQAKVDTKVVFQSLEFLKKSGHPDYQFEIDVEKYKRKCLIENLKTQFVDDFDVDMIIEFDEHKRNGYAYVPSSTNDVPDDEDDETEKMQDVIRKTHFNYDKEVCLVDKSPEATVRSENIGGYSFAPGEDKPISNFLTEKNWEIRAFPMMFPNGLNGLDQKREVSLRDVYYFVQRLRNCDPRFSDSTSYLFAAACYLEKKALQNNINISFQRGKKVQGPGGGTTYQLQDGFNVFDGIPNTPKYWKTFRNELVAKLDNVGPFHIFFTLSCADSLWEVCTLLSLLILQTSWAW